MGDVEVRSKGTIIELVEDTSERSCGESRSSERLLQSWTIEEARRFHDELGKIIDESIEKMRVHVNIPGEAYAKVLTVQQAERVRNQLNTDLRPFGM